MAYLIIFITSYLGALIIVLAINKAKNDRAASLLPPERAIAFRQLMNTPRVFALQAWAALCFGGVVAAAASGIYWLFASR